MITDQPGVIENRSSYLLEPWEESELKIFLTQRSLDYWKLCDITYVKRYLYVEDGQLKDSMQTRNSDEMYWTKSGDDLIENKATGVRASQGDLDLNLNFFILITQSICFHFRDGPITQWP